MAMVQNNIYRISVAQENAVLPVDFNVAALTADAAAQKYQADNPTDVINSITVAGQVFV